MVRVSTARVVNNLVMLCSLAIAIVISVEVISHRTIFSENFILRFQFVVCMVFLYDYLVRLRKSDNRLRFFLYNIIYLLVCIPYTNIISWLGISLNYDTDLILRLLPIVRGCYGVWLLMIYMYKSPISGLLNAYLLSLFMLIYFSSLFFFSLERGANPQVVDFSDALWWAFMNVTTVGSNIYAVTPIGKWLSVILAGGGMMMFPIFTVYVTSRFDMVYKKHRRKV